MDACFPSQIRLAAEDLAKRRFQDAHARLIAVLKIAPATADAYHLLGVLAAEHDNHEKACELYRRAIALNSSAARFHADCARSLVALFRREEALAAAEQAVRATGASPFTLDTIGVVFSRLGLHERATPFYKEATRLAPQNAGYAYNLGAALQFLGDFEGAEQAYLTVLGLEPGHVKAWSSIVSMSKQTSSKNHIEALERLFPTLTDADDRLNIGHALAKSYEDMGDVEQTMTWLDRAKSMKRSRVDPEEALNLEVFAAAAATARPSPAMRACDDPSAILIVGMPRTGTTLLDRILSRHSQVKSAGELSDFALEAKARARTPSPYVLDAETLAAVRDEDMEEIGRAYIARARKVVGDVPRFVDKMPLNFFYSALMLRAMPNARVICLRREPGDAVLSNYRQMFATGFAYYDYSYDLAWTARFYARFDRLMAEFRRCLPPDRFTEVSYESIVADIEGETRRLLTFCGLDWEPQCLDFHENAAPVATASSSQVRQPLYASSVGRWRRYAAYIQPALEVLEEEGVDIDAPPIPRAAQAR